MPWKLNERVIKPGKAWTDNGGTQHPGNWMIWSDDEKAAMGIGLRQTTRHRMITDFIGPNNPKALDDVNAVDDDGNAIIDPDTNQHCDQRG